MSITRRSFVAGGAAATAAPIPAGVPDAFRIARRHAIVRDLPGPNFFEGMLLGNGDIGVCVTLRPDALGLHIGKEDSWDIRVSEEHYRHVLSFADLLKLWERASEEARRRGLPDMIHLEDNIDFLREYTAKVTASYRKPWPRPWPCGTVWLHWDPRTVRLVRETLDPSNGLLTARFEQFELRCLVNQTTGHVLVWSEGPAPVVSVAYYPNIDREARLPAPELESHAGAGFAEFFCYQHFPATPPTEAVPDPPRSPKDRNFALCARLAGQWQAESHNVLRRAATQPLRLDVALFTPRDHPDNSAHARREAARLAAVPAGQLAGESERVWRGFWSRSAVEFSDHELERTWYHNQYFLACCLRKGKVAPGLFGNWSSGRIGTAWHGDYHMNYNTQQVFWGVFSSNHVEQHLPYVELCENLLPMSEAYAREKFGLPGAFFPHSAYPVPSETIPYPAPPWGYEICETPWTVQSLWWHYLYTLDKEYLRRVYPLLRAAARFLAAYVKQGHIVPTVSPENWGFTADFRLNKDCIMDLALSRFLLRAAAEAAGILGTDAGERTRWSEIAASLAPYPKAAGPQGEVWLDVPGAPVEYVYNVPVTLAPVFPGEQVGLGIGEEHLEIARRTARTVRLEGGNDLVYLPMILARLGRLDFERFKREVRYCLLPNGIANDRVRQVGGRYRDSTDFDFMMRMGVWTENLSLAGVLNECLLQSYTGVLRLSPNRRGLGPVRFRDLRAAGAFLVSAAWDGKTVSGVSLHSEKGARARLANPWPGAALNVSRGKKAVEAREENGLASFATEPGATYTIERGS